MSRQQVSRAISQSKADKDAEVARQRPAAYRAAESQPQRQHLPRSPATTRNSGSHGSSNGGWGQNPVVGILLGLGALVLIYLSTRPYSPFMLGASRAVNWIDVTFLQAHAKVIVGNEGAASGGSNSSALLPGVVVMLARNADLQAALASITSFEKRFNKAHHYPYVFLNDKPFTWEFIKKTSAAAKGSRTEYGRVPAEHWGYPHWINQSRAAETRVNMEKRRILYGGSESYRFMCRYFSGFFSLHPLLARYEYYWRLEPDVSFHCDMTSSDPFRLLHDTGKVYGFNIALSEIPLTIATLGDATGEFALSHPQYMAPHGSLRELMDSRGHYGGCHFWSNFEVGRLSWYRSEAYQTYFKHLDKNGGFFYERWGDAPVHTLAAAMLLNRSQIHYFEDIGYRHDGTHHCPQGEQYRAICDCDPMSDYNAHIWSGCLHVFNQTHKHQQKQ